jgi:putative ABC transport system permease protein
MNVRFGEFFDANAYDVRVDMNTILPADTLAAQVDGIAGIEVAQPALFGPVTAIRADGAEMDTLGLVLDEANPFFDLELLRGEAAFSSADGVWIGNNLARVLGVDVGDSITLRALGQAMDVEILGVVSYAVSAPVFVPGTLFAQNVPGGIFPANTLLIRVEDGQEAAVRDTVIALPNVIAAESSHAFEIDMNHYLEYFRVGTIIFGGFGYILTLALLFNTVNASLRERREELSILRALGSTPLEIALTVTLELLVMVMIGVVIGVPLGREMGFYLFRSYQTETYGTETLLTLPYYVIGLASMLVVIVLAEIPGLRAVQRMDLGAVSKSQSF